MLFLVSNAFLDVLHSESRLIDLRFFLIWFEGSLRWKENLAQKAAAAFLRRQQDTTNLQKLVYGNGRIWTSWPRDPGMKRADDHYCCCCCRFSFVLPVPTPLLPVSKLFQFLWFITVSLPIQLLFGPQSSLPLFTVYRLKFFSAVEDVFYMY